MTVLPFPGHKWARCKSQTCTGCHLCHGGLGVCVTCGGAEGSLPTDCPGKLMEHDVNEAVYNGEIDYLRSRGWVKQASRNSPAHYKDLP